MEATLSPLTVVEIPLEKIRPNPHNPGPPIPEDLIEDLAANVEAVGLQNPIKVMPDSQGGQWVILSGERRYRAFQRLKRESIPAIVLNPSPEEAVIITHTDNDVRDRGWWADYQSIEQLKQANPNLKQREVGAKLKIALPRVNRALGLLPLLNQASRVLLVTISNNQNKGIWRISEMAAAQLADLGDSALVEKALTRVLADQMTESQVKALVAAMKGGTPAEGYVPTPAKPKSPMAAQTEKPEIATSPTGPIGPAPRNDRNSQPVQVPVGAQIGAAVTGHFLWKQIAQAPGQILDRVFPRFMRVFRWVSGWFQKRGIANPFWANVLTAFLVLWLGSFLIHQATRLVGGILLKMSNSHLPAVSPSVNSGQALQRESNPSMAIPAQATVPVKPKAQNHPKTVSKPKPIQGAPVATAPVASAKTIPAWAQEGIPIAGDFAGRFYGISFANWDDTLNYLKAHMVGDGIQAMVDQYFPASLLRDMQTRMLAEYFSAKGTKVVGGEGDSAEILVQGTVTTLTRAGRSPQTVSAKPVALLMAFRHAEGFGSKIEKVTEVDPGTVANKVPNADLGKQIGDGLKDVSNAAGSVNNTVSAVDQAKKVLGF